MLETEPRFVVRRSAHSLKDQEKVPLTLIELNDRP